MYLRRKRVFVYIYKNSTYLNLTCIFRQIIFCQYFSHTNFIIISSNFKTTSKIKTRSIVMLFDHTIFYSNYLFCYKFLNNINDRYIIMNLKSLFIGKIYMDKNSTSIYVSIIFDWKIFSDTRIKQFVQNYSFIKFHIIYYGLVNFLFSLYSFKKYEV